MMAKSVSMLLSLSVLLIVLMTGCNHAASPEQQATNSNGPDTHVSDARRGAPGTSPVPDSSSLTAPAQAVPFEKDTRPVIVAFGDSLTAGYGTNGGESYPDYLQQNLNARGYHYRVVNEGISGNTSKDGVVRVQKIMALRPAVVIVAFGGNDGLRGIPILDTETNLKTIISSFQDAHIKVILGGITLPPNYGGEYIAKFNAMYKRQAQTYHVPLLPFMLKDVYGVPGDMQDDGTHATAKGNRQVAKNFLPLLLPLLHKLPHASAESSALSQHN